MSDQKQDFAGRLRGLIGTDACHPVVIYGAGYFIAEAVRLHSEAIAGLEEVAKIHEDCYPAMKRQAEAIAEKDITIEALRQEHAATSVVLQEERARLAEKDREIERLKVELALAQARHAVQPLVTEALATERSPEPLIMKAMDQQQTFSWVVEELQRLRALTEEQAERIKGLEADLDQAGGVVLNKCAEIDRLRADQEGMLAKQFELATSLKAAQQERDEAKLAVSAGAACVRDMEAQLKAARELLDLRRL